MKLSKSFELGLAIMLIIARQPDTSAISGEKVANQLQSSPTYSQKLLRKLVVAGLVKSAPGNNGGFQLARPASDITLTAVVQALNDTTATYHPSGLLSRINAQQANAERAFQTADLVWLQVLSQTSLADLLRQGSLPINQG